MKALNGQSTILKRTNPTATNPTESDDEQESRIHLKTNGPKQVLKFHLSTVGVRDKSPPPEEVEKAPITTTALQLVLLRFVAEMEEVVADKFVFLKIVPTMQ